MFFDAYVLFSLRLFKLKTEGQTIKIGNLTAKLQSYKTQITIIANPELAYWA